MYDERSIQRISSVEKNAINNQSISKATKFVKDVLKTTISTSNDILAIPKTESGIAAYNENVDAIITNKFKNKLL